MQAISANGVRLMAELRLLPEVGIGVMGGGAGLSGQGFEGETSASQRFLSRSLWHAVATASFHPWPEAVVRPWLRVEGGLAWARDAVDSHSVTQRAPAAGGTLGLDWAIGPHAVLTAEFALLFAGFGPSSATFDGVSYGAQVGGGRVALGATSYGGLTVWRLGLGGRWGWAL